MTCALTLMHATHLGQSWGATRFLSVWIVDGRGFSRRQHARRLETALPAAREFGVSLFAVPAGQREAVRRTLSMLAPEAESMRSPSPKE